VRKILSLLLLSCVLYLPICKVGIVSWFKINQEVIIKTLCVQKKKVKNTCKGHCVLNKKLDKVNQNSDSTPSEKKVNIKDITLFCVLSFRANYSHFYPNIKNPILNQPLPSKVYMQKNSPPPQAIA